jgi:hypothetical protein
MIAAGAILSLLALIAIVAVALALRSMVQDHERTESRLRDPHTHTITYAIPNGIDPVVFAVALKRCGYISMVEELGATQGLLVECAAADREQVRRAIAGVTVNAHDGSALKHDHVVFEDER